MSGNAFLERVAAGGGMTALYTPKYVGVKSLNGVSAPIAPIFTEDKSRSGSVTTGFGTYTLEEGSPAVDIAYDFLLPFDLAGEPRRDGGAVGAYEFGEDEPEGLSFVVVSESTVTLNIGNTGALSLDVTSESTVTFTADSLPSFSAHAVSESSVIFTTVGPASILSLEVVSESGVRFRYGKNRGRTSLSMAHFGFHF
jgi:hypothetical protein